MSDVDRLKSSLAKLAQSHQNRGFDAPDAAALVAGILTEIDETILPRRLQFTHAKGGAIWVDASKRRLIRAEGHDVDIAGLDTAGRDELRASWVAALGTGGAISTVTLRIPDGNDSDDLGLSAQGLADAWGLTLGPKIAKVPDIEAVRAALEGRTAARLDLSVEADPQFWGAPEWEDRLSDIANDHLEGLQTLMDEDDAGTQLLLFGGAAQTILLIVEGDEASLAAIPASGFPDFLAVLAA